MISILSFLLAGFNLISCSSGDDAINTEGPSTSGTIPENTDSGKNNNSQPDNITSGNNGTDSSTWDLVFEDNFDSTDSIPNPKYWRLAKRGDDTWNRYLSESYGQAYQKNGYLYLFGMLVGGEYKTGAIETLNNFSFTYGQVKCRARFLRSPQGNHTGIWMMPEPPAQQWPKSGEIDIMEHLDDQSQVFETVHYYNDNLGENASSHGTSSIDNEDFNVYGIIWNQDSIKFTVNGEVAFTYTNDNPDSEDFSYQYPFTKPFYLILSQSLGGKGTWEGVINDSELPAIFQIDWIKVWQKAE